MSQPPNTVLIKRKRNEEPVDFLRVHEAEANGKRRRRATDFVFSRQPTPNTASDSAPANSAIVFHFGRATCNTWRVSTRAAPSQVNQTTTHPADITTPTQSSTKDTAPQLPLQAARPRHFHISRSSTPNPLRPTPGGQGQIRKRTAKTQPTVFIERRTRPKTSQDPKKNSSGQDWPQLASDMEENRPQKKPGRNARSPIPRSRDSSPAKSAPVAAYPPVRNVRVTSSLLMPWDVSSEQLAAEMQVYTLQQIGYNLAESEATKPGIKFPPASHSRQNNKPSKFKPKKPALRYAERHPEEVVDGMEVDEYLDNDTDEDEDYIIDTYILIPAEALEATEMEKNIGLLILDSQPDINEFYREDGDSEEEEDDEDEDENAENHYTADYPDEEVDSDDEYGRNAYNYRNHNASDLEEFDENDATFSGDEDEATKYPWMKKHAELSVDDLDMEE